MIQTQHKIDYALLKVIKYLINILYNYKGIRLKKKLPYLIFKDTEEISLIFIWNNKRAWITKVVLKQGIQDITNSNFKLYYKAQKIEY